MEITWIGCDYGNEPHVALGHPQGVFIHWIVGTQSSCDAVFNREGRYASTHYSIAEDQVHQYVSESNAAWHCGASQNYSHLSIELEGWEGHPPTDGTMQTCAELIADMSKRYGWGKLVHTNPNDPNCNVWEHNWVAATSCPGETDVDEIVRRANVILGEEEDMSFDETWFGDTLNDASTSAGRTTPGNMLWGTFCDVENIKAKVENLSTAGIDYDKLATAVAAKIGDDIATKVADKIAQRMKS